MKRLNFKQIIAVTDRKLCSGDFFSQIEKIAALEPAKIILREKDLPDEVYISYAKQCIRAIGNHAPLVINGRPAIAKALRIPYIHLSYSAFMENRDALAYFSCRGVSVHSIEEAVQAAQAGADYLIAGHIFETSCKAGLPGRGTAFLKAICQTVDIPVYAIGGITPENFSSILACGAAGGCMMSGLMQLK